MTALIRSIHRVLIAPVVLLVGLLGCSHRSEKGRPLASRQPAVIEPPALAAPPPLFDLVAIRDPATADCRFENQHEVSRNGVALLVWSVSYLSWESVAGTLHPIRIRAFAARPRSDKGRVPAVVSAHGLGGFANEGSATGLAADLGLFVLAYSGPGSGGAADGTSEGRPSTYGSNYRLFDTLHAPDGVRGSWFWAHTTAALRALTCLAARSDVDVGRLGMTGFSAGGVASLLAAGVDDRVKVAVPVSGTLSLTDAVRAPAAWEHALLSQAGLSTASAEWKVLASELTEPTAALSHTTAKILLLDGSTDEFFPLPAYLATLQAVEKSPGASDVRISLSGNFDHGCYRVNGGESAVAIAQRATVRSEGGQRAFFRHYLANDPHYPVIPRPAQVTITGTGAPTAVSAVVDHPHGYDIDEVRLWWSTDAAYSFSSLPLDAKSATLYQKVTAVPLTAATVYFVDVQYRTAGLLSPHRFAISTEPVLPAGFIPHIRTFGTCQ